MKKIGGVFYFNFRFEDEEDDNGDIPTTNYAFNFNEKAVEILGEDFPNNQNEQWFEELFWDIEAEFGVHDWVSYPCDEVVGIGYTTYEASRKEAKECVERWRQEFVKKVGEENVSPTIFELKKDIIDDLDAFEKVKKLESKLKK